MTQPGQATHTTFKCHSARYCNACPHSWEFKSGQ